MENQINRQKVIISFLVLLLFLVNEVIMSCDPKDKSRPSCQCKTEKGFTVDLEKVFDDVKKEASVPLFSKQAQGYDYTFQPCKPFDCGSKTGASVCQKGSNLSFEVGIQNKASFTGSIYNNTLKLEYEGEADAVSKKNRQTVINLKCHKGETSFDGIGETVPGSLHYEFTLQTPRVCPPKGLSTGSILLIVFFVLVIVYLVGGVLYMRFVRGATGIEMVPNLEFWKEVPALVKDGFLFVSRGCKSDPTYNQI